MSEPEVKTMEEQLALIVDEWHFECFHGSAVARDTEVWNLVHAAKDDLKQRLTIASARVATLTQTPTPTPTTTP